MNKKQLIAFREDVNRAIGARERLGEFDANSRDIIWLLKNMGALVDHAIATYPKPPKK